MMKIFKTFMLLTLALSLVVSCKKKEDDPDPNPGDDQEISSQDLKVSESVFVVGPELVLTSSQNDLENGIFKYTFTGDDPAVEPGSILIDSTGHGYLRKVESVDIQGDQLRCETSQARLEDIFTSGTLAFKIDLGRNTKSLGDSDTIKYALIDESYESGVTTSNHVDYSLNAALSSQLTATGSFSIEPKINFKWVFSEENGLEQMNCFLDNTSIDLETTLAFTASGSASATIQKSLGTYTKGGWFIIYGIPVLFEVQLELLGVGYLEFEETANFPISFTNTSLLSYGVTYNQGATNFVTGFSNSSEINTTPVFDATGQVRLDIIPQVNISFYGILGNVIKPKPFVELNARYVNEGGVEETCASIDAGMDLGLGVKGEIFGESLFDFSKDFNVARTTLWKSNDDCVIPAISITDPSWEIGTHSCGTDKTPYTITFSFSENDSLIGPGTTLTDLYRFYAPSGSSSGSITRSWDDMTLQDNTLSFNICIGWVSATYVEQSFYLVSADGVRSNMISVIIPSTSLKNSYAGNSIGIPFIN